jgi:hypothetical protein
MKESRSNPTVVAQRVRAKLAAVPPGSFVLGVPVHVSLEGR